MYLLYLDDAGSVKSANETHFVLSGICVFERQVHYLTSGLDDLAKQICPQDHEQLEFHGSHMLPGKGFWRSIRDKDERRKHIRNALAECRKLRGTWALFGVVVEKAAISPEDPIEFAFEQICSRFDAFLKRQFRMGNKQRGLIILDKSTRETRLQALATEFGKSGHRYGILHSLADVPMFVDSAATRAIQFADLVSYALWQKFERGDDQFFNVIGDSFDAEGGVVHGLLHRKSPTVFCDCPYCLTRGGRLI
ncbi:MAG: DUF3800 domain-containing protein [Rhodobacteraceae bacterium]|nr:MAG: DUF3800 domain-containing protein [Paracoccaceae bacterium]